MGELEDLQARILELESERDTIKAELETTKSNLDGKTKDLDEARALNSKLIHKIPVKDESEVIEETHEETQEEFIDSFISESKNILSKRHGIELFE